MFTDACVSRLQDSGVAQLEADGELEEVDREIQKVAAWIKNDDAGSYHTLDC